MLAVLKLGANQLNKCDPLSGNDWVWNCENICGYGPSHWGADYDIPI